MPKMDGGHLITKEDTKIAHKKKGFLSKLSNNEVISGTIHKQLGYPRETKEAIDRYNTSRIHRNRW